MSAKRDMLREALWRDPAQLARIAAWSVLEAAPAFLIGNAVARALEGFAAHRVAVGLDWLGLLFGAWIVAAIAARQVVLAVAAVVEPFRDRLLSHTVAGAIRQATGRAGRPPDTAAVARSNLQVELARDAFAAVITVIRTFVFTVIGVVVGLTALMPRLLLLVLPPFVAGVGLFLLSLPALARRQRAYLLADEATAESVTTVATSLRDIVACGAEDRLASRVGERLTAQASAARALARVTGIRTVALGMGGWLPVGTILIATPWLARSGANAGIIVGALTYVTQSLAPALRGLVQGLGVSGVRLAVALDRILEAGRPSGSAPVSAVQVPARETAVGGTSVELRDVTFKYAPYAEPVLSSLDLVVPHGEHLAVVGPSGIGKSTLAALITGLLEPTSGSVLVGGVPASRVDPAARVLIPQEAYVFRGTLLENLTYLADAPMAAVQAAVEAVGAGEIVRLTGGYDTEFDPGILSAGQRQLVALVRAYLAPGRLTILDEATCHLDLAAEVRAEAAFVSRGGTLIVIAHRIGSARRAQRVLLMDGTRVLLGTHEELRDTAALYAELTGEWQPIPGSCVPHVPRVPASARELTQ
jgi:ABC-type multidrug transport system fused ATPase/permease subunit